jgi:release factor glutamine methyltransferase
VDVASVLVTAIDKLATVSDTAKLDAELLLCEALKCERTTLFAFPERELTVDAQVAFSALLTRRVNHEPVAYILGKKEFWSMMLQVSPATLIPRPETETAVEVALALCEQASARVLDLGTGSGAIALALATERPMWRITGVDCCQSAVDLAEENRQIQSLGNVRFFQSDWFASIDECQFDVIVSNPPYIAQDDEHLHRAGLQFEPITALVAGQAGLADLYHIAEQAIPYLNGSGWLILEHGYEQAAAVRSHLQACGYRDVHSICDVSGHERVTSGRRSSGDM